MIVRLANLVRRWLGRPAGDNAGVQRLSGKPSSANIGETAQLVHVSNQEEADSVVAFDENLLERSRTQWQFGDWGSLARLDRETLQHHPDRAKLALLAAAGHQGQGNAVEARRFSRLALDWGCNKKLVSQILVGGVHNTLARAAALGGHQQRALDHFESAVATVNPGSEHRLIARARAREEIERLGLTRVSQIEQPAEWAALANSSGRITADEDLRRLAEELQQQNTALSQQLKQQASEMSALGKALEGTVRREMLNATQQLEAYLGIQSYLGPGDPLPNMHGWPVSPDFALYLIELIAANDYDLIIEFGSGTSTVLMARALARNRVCRGERTPTIQVAFEHLERYCDQTQQQLEQSGMGDQVRLVLAPLKPYVAPNGQVYSYYDCQEVLGELAQLTKPASKILLVVDGPPAATGRHARYPAVPAVLAHFKEQRIDVLLDDYIREDEKEIAQLWLEDISAAGFESRMTTRKMEKDACFISISQ